MKEDWSFSKTKSEWRAYEHFRLLRQLIITKRRTFFDKHKKPSVFYHDMGISCMCLSLLHFTFNCIWKLFCGGVACLQADVYYFLCFPRKIDKQRAGLVTNIWYTFSPITITATIPTTSTKWKKESQDENKLTQKRTGVDHITKRKGAKIPCDDMLLRS